MQFGGIGMKAAAQQKTWGRASTVDLFSWVGTLGILTLTPLMVFYFMIACTRFGGSLFDPIPLILNGEFSLSWLPPFSFSACALWGSWLIFQIILAVFVPDYFHKWIPGYVGGYLKGAVTPAGNQLPYNINGLQAWAISHLLFVVGAFGLGLFSPTIIFENWGPLLWMANIGGYSLAIFAYVKAYLFPSFAEDRKFSGSRLYDFYMGIELNPRIRSFDFKLFFNGRPGIILWTMINLSFAAKQYALYGTVTNSMILVNFFQLLYVLYFFWQEAWYLHTIDIHHDHFGWMLAWGDLVWLPFMYTLQGFYLVFNPVELSTPYAIFVLLFGLSGYAIFHSANRQKDRFRKGELKGAEFIPVTYTAKDGKTRESKLLISGWWGKARHFNYTGDLILSLAYSLACGFGHLLPYFYFVFLSILLIHRCLRDEHRMAAKYGAGWTKYKEKVPYRMIPGVF